MGRRAKSRTAPIPQPLDKVRLKAGPHAGRRGVIREIRDGAIIVALDGDAGTLLVNPHEVQNYSLAARKAWQTAPQRQGIGGRKPKSERPRLPVAFRVDPLVWDLLKEAEMRGLIANRTEAINQWILAGVTDLLRDVRPVERVGEQDHTRGPNVISLSGKGH